MNTPQSGTDQSNSREDSAPKESGNVSSLRRALELLWGFRGVRVDLGLTELAQRADMPKSTAYRLLRDLESAGFIERAGTKYRLGLALFELGSRVDIVRPRGLRNSAIHPMTVLHTDTGLTLHLGMLHGDEVLLLEKLHHPRSPRINTTAGQRVPAARTALGKALLAFAPDAVVDSAIHGTPAKVPHREPINAGVFQRELQSVRKHRLAYNREELMPGLVCVATPIHSGGRVVGALSASITTGNVDVPRLETLLLHAANEIGRLHNLNELATA